MLSLAAWNNGAWYVCIALQAALILHLWRKDLLKVYPCLAILVSALTLRSLMLQPFGSGSLAYKYIWASTEPILMGLQVWMALKIFHSYADHYPTLGKLRHQALWVILAMSVALAITAVQLGGVFEITRLLVRAVSLLKVHVSCGLLAVLILSTAFFSFLRVPVRPNLATHRLISTVYVGSSTGAYLLFVRFGRPALPYTTFIDLTAACVCMALWIWKLRATGELVGVIVPTPEGRAEREHLRAQSIAAVVQAASVACDRDDRTTQFEL